jgi:hypothetical protein
MDLLRLAALDEDDLTIISAHAQDAVAKVGDIDFLAASKKFALPLNRFAWEAKAGWFRRHDQRRRSLLSFDRVLGVRSTGIDRGKPDEILSLLALRFTAAEAPSGMVQLIFSGGAAIALDVECIEARLADTGGAWEASSRPVHRA